HERAAERDVDDLHSAADAEYRQRFLPRQFENGEVRRVPVLVQLDAPVREHFPAVPRGMHVQASAENHAVEGALRLRARREDDDLVPPEARVEKSPNVVIPLALRSLVTERQCNAHRYILANADALPLSRRERDG